MEPMPWFERRFSFDEPVGAFPAIVERLRAAPAALEERLEGAGTGPLTRRVGTGWSILEHVGHLGDLEELWARRLDDLLAGAAELTAADLTNRRTFEAGHDRTPLPELLARFRGLRRTLVARLEACGPADVERSALHPRLRRPMRTIDHAYFVAEHDAHHLAHVTALLATGADGGTTGPAGAGGDPGGGAPPA